MLKLIFNSEHPMDADCNPQLLNEEGENILSKLCVKSLRLDIKHDDFTMLVIETYLDGVEVEIDGNVVVKDLGARPSKAEKTDG